MDREKYFKQFGCYPPEVEREEPYEAKVSDNIPVESSTKYMTDEEFECQMKNEARKKKNLYNKEYYCANKVRLIEYHRKYRENDREKHNANARKYAKNNREKVLLACSKWYYKHSEEPEFKEKARLRSEIYAKNNREKQRLYSKRYRENMKMREV